MKFMDTDSLNDIKHTFVIAEAGSNWKCGSYDDDMNMASNLIKTAAKSGADAIKFQTYRSHTVYAPNAGESDYLADQGFKKNINEIFDYLSMPYKMIPELSLICKNEGIELMSTPFSIEDAKNIDPFVSVHKIASYEINHIKLLEYLASTSKPLIISTGASIPEEIEYAIKIVNNKGNKKIVLLQCTAKYPAPFESLNLSVIPFLKSKYNLPVGLSDHSLDPILAPVLSVGLGATVIEKHFTLDKNLPGPDHSFALDPMELTLMIKSIRQADIAKGYGIKNILPEEEELRRFATRSLQATKSIKQGDVLHEGLNFDVLRPGKNSRGSEARYVFKIEGKKATKNYKIGEGILEL
jgi:N,N'-diacetyllegionaminate synthase